MKKSTDDQIIAIRDGASRRKFIQAGSAFVLAGTAGLHSSSLLASECDRGRGSGEKKPEQAGNGSDSDAGATADAIGCGRQYKEPPKISSIENGEGTYKPVVTVKVRG